MMDRRMIINKSCFLINEDPGEQAVFLKALNDVSPQTLCFTALDGSDGLYMMLKEGLIPDFIFIEMITPRMDALAFLRQIKKIETLKDIPVVVHALRPKPNEVIAMKEAGAAALYLKDYDYDGICSVLNLYMSDIIPIIHPN
jgi:DNA-binding NarL/FixJ family response regulator